MKQDHEEKLSPLSYAELLNAVKANDPGFACTPEEARYLQWEDIFRKIDDNTPFKETLSRRISPLQALRETQEQSAEAGEIMSLVDALAGSRDWERIQKLVNLCLSWQNSWNEDSANSARKRQTEAANESRRLLPKIKTELLDFEELLKAAEFFIHPPKGTAEYEQSHCTNWPLQLTRFCKAHQDEIEAKMKAHRISEDYVKHFRRLFEVYTEIYLQSGVQSTVSGYVPQKRKPRSAESRERSRQGALRSPKRKKKIEP